MGLRPAAAFPKPVSGSGPTSAMGLNPRYGASMPFEMMFDPQIQYNLLTKPLAAKYGLEGPASLLNPENYSYKNLQDGISKFGNTLGNVTNLMAYGTPIGAAFAGANQAANTAGAQGNTTPGNALAGAGGAAMVTFAVKNILSRGSAAGMAGQTILELTKLAGAFGKSEIVNAVKNLTGADIGGYIDTAFNADTITNQIPNFLTRPDLLDAALGSFSSNEFKTNSQIEFRSTFVHQFLKRLTPQQKLDVDNAHKSGAISLYPRYEGGNDSTFIETRSPTIAFQTEGERLSAERGTELYTQYLETMKQLLLPNVKQQFDQPIAVNLPYVNALKFYQDNLLKNIHDPGMTSMGHNNPQQRKFYENAVFDIDSTDPRQYPNYGYSMNPEYVEGDLFDPNKASAGYGNLTLVLKDLIKDRAFATFGDSKGNGGLQPVPWGTLDPTQLEPAIGGRMHAWMFDPFRVKRNLPQYTEAQIIPGPSGLTLNDVARMIYRIPERQVREETEEHKQFMDITRGLGIPFTISPLRGRALDE